jgi:hypothetical protein
VTAPIEALLGQEVEWTELPEPEKKDGLYAVQEGTLEIGAARFRAYVLNDGQRVFDADDVAGFFRPLKDEFDAVMDEQILAVANEDGEQVG